MDKKEAKTLLFKLYSLKLELERIKKVEYANKFCNYLKQNNIHYDFCIRHQEVLGCNESSYYYQQYKDYLKDYAICKHLLLKERKGKKRIFLIITDSNKKVDLLLLKEQLNCQKLEFVNNEEMKQLINTTPGNVSIFNMIFDSSKKVNLILDEILLEKTLLAFHPLYNGMSIFLSPKECFKFIKLIDKDINILKIFTKSDSKIISKI